RGCRTGLSLQPDAWFGAIDGTDISSMRSFPIHGAVTWRKIDRTRRDDRSVRDRAAPRDSPDDWVYRDRAAAPGTAHHAGGERGRICQPRFRPASCLNRIARQADWSGAREHGRTVGLRDGRPVAVRA